MAVTAYRDANFFVYSPDFIALLYSESAKVAPISTSYPEFFMNNWVFVFEILRRTRRAISKESGEIGGGMLEDVSVDRPLSRGKGSCTDANAHALPCF